MASHFTRILVPTDFSAPSNAALALAKRMATTSGASLHLLHVLEDPFTAAAYATEVYAAPPAGLTDSWLKGAQALLDTQLTPNEQVVFRSTQQVRFGSPARDIVSYATANNIDLIVIGTHGRGGVHHLLMGSVAERVVRAAPCPVLTVRDSGKVQCEVGGATATAVA